MKADELVPEPENRVLLFMYRVAVHVSFDVVMNTLILINMIPIVFELTSPDDAWYMGTLKIVNYIYCVIYVIEASWKVSRHRVNPFTPKSDQFQISLAASPEI